MYEIRSGLIPIPEGHSKPITETLKWYDEGRDITNSPLIQSKVNLTHIDVWRREDKDQALQDRQKELIRLYESIKQGYNGSKVWCWFDKEGEIHLYDGYHRLSILQHLSRDIPISVETEWQGIGKSSQDFPLAETIKAESGQWVYQPINDPRLKDFKVIRSDSPQRLECIKKHLVGNTVLDIGCSEGYFSRELAKLGYKVTAIDFRPRLIAVARYLSILEGVHIDFKCVRDWSEFDGVYDNILFLCIIHNDMKKMGVEAGLKKLELLRGKCQRLFFEAPQETGEREWNREGFPAFSFRGNTKKLEDSLGMSLLDTWSLTPKTRPIFTFDSVPWWTPEKYIPDWRNQYWPLFETLRTKECRNILEVGTHNGRNAVAMIKTAGLKVPEDEIHYYGFDLFGNKTDQLRDEEYSPVEKVTRKEVRDFIKSCTSAQVILFEGNSRETLKADLTKMDLIYIDGGHSIETTRSDWLNCQRFMKDDTVVYFDDYNDEMPFLGSYFITKELSLEYKFEVLPQTNYYKRPFGRLKCQLLRVTKKVSTHKTGKLRLHLLGLPHSKTIKDWGPCAFTKLVYRFSQMMTDLGHEVYHYGTEGSNPQCTEQIDVLTEAVQKQAYGDWDCHKQLWIHNGNDLAYRTFRTNAITEINKRKEKGDILLISNGNWLREVSDKTNVMAVEPFVGYLGCYTKRRVFPSYAWMHHMYGLQAKQKDPKENFVTGQWYDAVIPHFFDPSDYTFETKKDDYFIYFGRLIQRKGVHIAADITKRIGAKLLIAGQPMWPDRIEESLKHVGCLQPHVEYLGVLGEKELDKYVSKAKAALLPSLYMEPFGLVVVESLLSGTPVITTDWGSFPEIVPQGEVGYRCRTADDFIWACNNIHKIDPQECRDYAVNNYSMERIGKSYEEYFTKISDLSGKGWYAQHPERESLDWLKRY